MKLKNKAHLVVERGDYQTPQYFSDLVCEKLKKFYNLRPTAILEPTFGMGNFISSVFTFFNSTDAYYGIEIDENYYLKTKARFSDSKQNVLLYNEDIFNFNFSKIKTQLTPHDSILIVGNPPWVTNSQLSSISSCNTPQKSNFKNHSGLDAITGRGNFDVAEYIILRLLSEFSNYNCTLAFLCKTIVSKNIIRDLNKYNFNISSADMFIFDAKEVFDVSCDAGLFVIRLGGGKVKICDVYDFYTNNKIKQFGWVENNFFSDLSVNGASEISGKCQFEWRQGIKHDCSKVMELTKISNGLFENGLREQIELSVGEYIYPLLKSSNLKTTEISETKKFVIVPQRKVNEPTSSIECKDITLWNYLVAHENLLNNRKSIIYKKSPKFSIFGIGDYSFSQYKVGISGFYKNPIFSLIHGVHPIMMDDTCYFLSFDKLSDAIIATALLNSKEAQTFLKSVAFLDSKRPYTKDVLSRIDFLKLSTLISYQSVSRFALKMQGHYSISKIEYKEFIDSLKGDDFLF